jgi:hypothetical protein
MATLQGMDGSMLQKNSLRECTPASLLDHVVFHLLG